MPFNAFRIVSLWQIMETLKAGELFISVVGLSNFSHNKRLLDSSALLTENYQNLKDKIDLVCAELERLELPVSLASAKNLRKVIYEEAVERTTEPLPPQIENLGKWMIFPSLAADRYQNFAKELVGRLKVELSAKNVLILPWNKAKFYDSPNPLFSDDVRDSFPSAVYDMDEACKCFALGRYTASVFHQMRVMEVGLNALGISLGLAVASNWGQAIQDIENEIKSRNNKTHGPTWKTDHEPFYAEAAAHFRMVKNAWRNHAMHTKDKFDEERAKDILNSVVAFMRHLATRLHE